MANQAMSSSSVGSLPRTHTTNTSSNTPTTHSTPTTAARTNITVKPSAIQTLINHSTVIPSNFVLPTLSTTVSQNASNNIASMPILIQPQSVANLQYFTVPSMPNAPLILIPANVVSGTPFNLLSNHSHSHSHNQSHNQTHNHNHKNSNNANNNNNNQPDTDEHKHTRSQTSPTLSGTSSSISPPSSHSQAIDTDSNTSSNGSNNSTTTTGTSTINNNSSFDERIKQILGKFNSNIALSNEETVLLQNAVQSARMLYLQQWYQQQQRLLSNTNNTNNNNNKNNSKNANGGSVNAHHIPPLQAQIAVLQQHQQHLLQAQHIQSQLIQAQQLQQQQQQMLKPNKAAQSPPLRRQSVPSVASTIPVLPTNTVSPLSPIASLPPTINVNLSMPSTAQSTPFTSSSMSNAYTPTSCAATPNMYHGMLSDEQLMQNKDWRTYFRLPYAQQFDALFYANQHVHGGGGEPQYVSVFGEPRSSSSKTTTTTTTTKKTECFDLEIDALGRFEFGTDVRHKYDLLSLRAENCDNKSARLCKALSVKDVSSTSCPWLVQDLVRCQTQLQSATQSVHHECRRVSIRVQAQVNDDDDENDDIQQCLDRQQSTTVPHVLLQSFVDDSFYGQNKILQMSHVDLSRVHIEKRTRPYRASQAIHRRHNLRKRLRKFLQNESKDDMEYNTLDFLNLCEMTHENFDPTEVVSTIPECQLHPNIHTIFFRAACLLRQNMSHFGPIPCVAAPPPHTQPTTQLQQQQQQQPYRCVYTPPNKSRRQQQPSYNQRRAFSHSNDESSPVDRSLFGSKLRGRHHMNRNNGHSGSFSRRNFHSYNPTPNARVWSTTTVSAPPRSDNQHHSNPVIPNRKMPNATSWNVGGLTLAPNS